MKLFKDRSSALLFTGWLGTIALTAWLCATPCAAATQEALLTAQRAEEVLKQYVLKHSPWQSANVELRVVGFSPVALPAGTLAYRVLKPNLGITPGTTSFLLAVDAAGKEQQRLWIKAEIRIFEEVVVSSTPLAARNLVYAKDIRLERRDVSALHARPYKRIDAVAGQQVSRALEINEILTEKSVDRPTLMRRGAPITLVYETRNLRVESPGLTVEPGKIGETIQVKNPSSGKLIRGVVVDERTVRIN
jgi:flagella basal body P-ring formation protein FlgA